MDSPIPQLLSNAPNLNNITDVIRAKERELQKIQDLRTSQLEALIEERDQLLFETSKRFEQLKDDFQYNLTLIDARDKEIERLEKALEVQTKSNNELESHNYSLTTRIETLHLREQERADKIEEEKALNKKVLSELKTVIESLQWTAEEEAKTKATELAGLRREIRSLQSNKDEALELQRKDLTEAFEQIIHQREESIAQRESEVARQLDLLDQKFERLHTENTNLKAALRETKLNHERCLEDLNRREESIRHLTYQLEDTQKSKDLGEDSLKRQYQSLQIEFEKLVDSKEKEKSQLEALIEKANAEMLREKEFRNIIERRMEDNHQNFSIEMSSLSSEIAMYQNKLHQQNQELLQIRTEKDQLVTKLGTKRIELETLTARNDLLSEELQNYNDKFDRLSQEAHRSEGSLAQALTELEHFRLSSEKEKRAITEACKDEITQARFSTASQIEEIKKENALELAKMKKYYDGLMRDQAMDFDAKLRAKEEQLYKEMKVKDELFESIQEQLTKRDADLNEQRMEADALKLRLRAQESQWLELNKEIKSLQKKSDGSQGIAEFTLPRSLSSRLPPPSTGGGSEFSLGDALLDIPSPMMSEDFNIRSLPESPMLSSANDPRRRVDFSNNNINNNIHSNSGNFGFSSREFPENDQRQSELAQENERLKKIVHEMRKDIEQLHTQTVQQAPVHMPPMPPSPVRNKSNVNTNSAPTHPDLENLLEQSKDEIHRLRNERKKLMDTGNELRSALIKMQSQSSGDLEKSFDSTSRVRDETQWSHHSEAKSDGGAKKANNVWDVDYLSHLRTGGPSPATRRLSAASDEMEFLPSPEVKRAADSGAEYTTSDSDFAVVGEGFGYSVPSRRQPIRKQASAGITPRTNSDRTTNSQAQALQRLKAKQPRIPTANTATYAASQPRKIINYGLMNERDDM